MSLGLACVKIPSIPVFNRAQHCTMSTLMGLVSRVTSFPSAPVALLHTGYSIKNTTGTSQMRMQGSSGDGASTQRVTETPFPGTPSTCITSRRTGGNLSVCLTLSSLCFLRCSCLRLSGNYDVTKLHYDGPGQVPGAPGGGYGYDVRTEALSTSDSPIAQTASTATPVVV